MAFKKRELPKPKPTQEMLNAMTHAKNMAPRSEFVLSCQAQLRDKGYLSPRQVESLFDVGVPRMYDDDYDPFAWLDDPSDFF